MQSKDADNKLLCNILAQNNIRLTDRTGSTDAVVVILPLSAVEILAQSGLINYTSPDRPTLKFRHLEKSIGTEVVRSQSVTATRAAHSLDGTGIGIAIVDSGMAEIHKAFKTNGTTGRIIFSQISLIRKTRLLTITDTERTLEVSPPEIPKRMAMNIAE